MTNASFIKAKAWYESQLVDKLADALGQEKSKITAEWRVNTLKATIDLTQGDVVTKYYLTYADNNVTLEVDSYKNIYTDPLDENARTLTGIQARRSSIDYNTLGALGRLMEEVVNTEYVEEVETPVEPAEPAQPIAPVPEPEPEPAPNSDGEVVEEGEWHDGNEGD